MGSAGRGPGVSQGRWRTGGKGAVRRGLFTAWKASSRGWCRRCKAPRGQGLEASSIRASAPAARQQLVGRLPPRCFVVDQLAGGWCGGRSFTTPGAWVSTRALGALDGEGRNATSTALSTQAGPTGLRRVAGGGRREGRAQLRSAERETHQSRPRAACRCAGCSPGSSLSRRSIRSK